MKTKIEYRVVTDEHLGFTVERRQREIYSLFWDVWGEWRQPEPGASYASIDLAKASALALLQKEMNPFQSKEVCRISLPPTP